MRIRLSGLRSAPNTRMRFGTGGESARSDRLLGALSLGTVREWKWRAEFIEHLAICYDADQLAVVYHRQASDQSFPGVN